MSSKLYPMNNNDVVTEPRRIYERYQDFFGAEKYRIFLSKRMMIAAFDQFIPIVVPSLIPWNFGILG